MISPRRVHLFESRNELFSENGVLQENIVLHGRKEKARQPILVACSRGDQSVSEKMLGYEQVFRPGDNDMIVHLIADSDEEEIVNAVTRLSGSLSELGVEVSTGRVVDFRARDYLYDQPGLGRVPLIFPQHFRQGSIEWPCLSGKKANAIADCGATRNLFVPSGFYVLVKRFSAKEERRRIVAAILDPRKIEADWLAFDNKTNFFHVAGRGLSEALAKGLATYLNSTIIDRYFRLFSGHTQVNAEDLRRLPYPAADQLLALAGSFGGSHEQARIDKTVSGVLRVLGLIVSQLLSGFFEEVQNAKQSPGVLGYPDCGSSGNVLVNSLTCSGSLPARVDGRKADPCLAVPVRDRPTLLYFVNIHLAVACHGFHDPKPVSLRVPKD